MRRLCFDQDHNFYPTMMADGRVLYTRWEYTDIAHAFTGRLFTMNPDGTGQRAHYASSSFWPNRIFYASPVPDRPTKFVGIVTGHHGTARAGELVLFDVAKGRRQAEGAVQRIPGRGKTVEAMMVDQPGRRLLAEVPPPVSPERQVLPGRLPADPQIALGASTWSTCSTTCSCSARRKAACCSSPCRCGRRRARRSFPIG